MEWCKIRTPRTDQRNQDYLRRVIRCQVKVRGRGKEEVIAKRFKKKVVKENKEIVVIDGE